MLQYRCDVHVLSSDVVTENVVTRERYSKFEG